MSRNGERLAYPSDTSDGLTKRELFAMNAMNGYLSMLVWSEGIDEGSVEPCVEEVARESLAYADALLEELAKG